MGTQPSNEKNSVPTPNSAAIVVCGDPQTTRASFSRFILPFAWEMSPLAGGSLHGDHFRPATATDWIHSAQPSQTDTEKFLDLSRRKYLSKEVDAVLFKRAGWFVLKARTGVSNDIWKEFFVRSGLDGATHSYKVTVRPPAIMLFENEQDSPSSNGSKSSRERTDVLRTGFLIIEAFFPHRKETDPLHLTYEDGITGPVVLPTYEDILRFNEIFRYWRCPHKGHDKFCKNELDSIYMGWNNAKETTKDIALLYSDRWLDLLHAPIQADKRVVRPILKNNSSDKHGDVFPSWLVNPDDRTFVCACMVVESNPPDSSHPTQISNSPVLSTVADGFVSSDPKPPPLDVAGYWVKLLNVDRPYQILGNGKCTPFEWEWATQRTYRRWAHFGSLYGFTPHSFALLAAWDKDNEPPIGLHFGQMYFDTTLLLLYLRVSLFRFSHRLHEISRDARKESANKEFEVWKVPFEKVRWDFLMFENLYQFPLLSNQQQHLEMYTLQRKCLDVEELYKEIDKEIRSSDEVLDNRLDAERNKLASILNVVAAVGLAIALALGWMDAHSEKPYEHTGWWIVVLFFAAFVILAISIFLSRFLIRKMLCLAEKGKHIKPNCDQ